MMTAIISATSCTEVTVENIAITPSDSSTTLYASAATTPATKVAFTDNDTEGIALAWELGDEFTLYNGEVKVGTFTCEDAESGVFKGSATLTEGTEYTAMYNEETTIEEQNGDEINDLNAACKMSASFVYGEDETIIFEHEMAIMTFIFESDSKPAKLIFENGEESYTVIYTDIEPIEGLYTSHIMIAPCEATERTLTFSLYTADATEAYDIRTVSTSKAYAAGYRYTASISNIEIAVAGSASNPYKISTADELRQLSTDVNSGTTYVGEYFLMTNDINLGGVDILGVYRNVFTAIGNSSEYSFQGTFDGGGYKVSGLYISQLETNYQALFGYISDATIKNVGVSGSIIGNSYVGGVVGFASSSTVSGCYNECKVEGNVQYLGGVIGYAKGSTIVSDSKNSGTISGKQQVGGVVGYSSFEVYDCYNEAEISGISNVGGVVGYTTAVVRGCSNDGSISGSGSFIGGVVGYAATNTTTSSVSDCYNSGTVLGASNSKHVGGVVGLTYSDVSNSGNDGDVLGGNYTGGVVGNSSGTVNNCYNSGAVSGAEVVGGVVGDSYATVSNCYNRGDISGDNYIGGVVGSNFSSTIGCYNTGLLDGSYRGAIAGELWGYATVSYCYFDLSGYSDEIVGYNYIDSLIITNVEGKTTEEMTDASFVATLNSATDEDCWVADSTPNINDGYPIFTWQ